MYCGGEGIIDFFSEIKRPMTQPIGSRRVFVGRAINFVFQSFFDRDELIIFVLINFHQRVEIIGVQFVGVKQQDMFDISPEQNF